MKASLRRALLVVLLAFAGVAHAITYELVLDLTDGTLFHDSPTYTHPSDPPGFVFGDGRKEIEDNYFSPTLRFAPTLLDASAPARETLTLSIRFKDADTSAQQYLFVDAKGTGSPFPETFAIRFPGKATHATIGPGMFFYGSGGTVGGIADGTVTTTLGSVIGFPAVNGYATSFRCAIDDCQTRAHFPSGADLTDGSFAFGSMRLDLQLTAFERCSLTRPDCGGITLGGFGFGMLAGDLAILSATPPIPEPATLWLLAAGLTAMGLTRARRRER